MRFQNSKTISYCIGGRDQSAITNIYGDITFKGSKVWTDHFSICKRKISTTVSDNTIVAEGLGDFSKNLVNKGLYESKKMAEIFWKIQEML